MAALARSSLFLLGAAAVIVLGVDLLAPDDQRGTVPVELMVLLIGAVAILQLLAALERRWPDAWRSQPAWWSVRTERSTADPRPDAVREWEALLVTGTTGEQRGRQRLCRRLDRLTVPGSEPLLAELRRAQPNQVLDLVERFTSEVERTHDD